ncbi:AvrD family protein [uncultured Streptococcus sp.]|uniref:AvrD family protein n=1 Tax=uncultured Streptococcus sp. TaxID=83427 RepID=UPI001092228F
MLTVDYLLGDNKNRYFGRGYKRTTYEVNTLRKSNSNYVSVALPYSSTACG